MNTIAREFSESASRYTADLQHRDLIQRSMDGYYAKRDENKNRFQSWAGARNAAAEIKWQAINHLDQYLEEFASKLEARGVKVFWAADARAARDHVVQIARQNKVRSIVKSKSMTTEEIHLNDALEKEGFEVVESDLGEYIVQLRQEPPYHLVFPAMHLRREQISDLFHDKLGSAPTDQPEELTMIARRVMRRKFCGADMGITSANFCVAETGMISITENEGNARLTAALPKIHVAVIGMEKVVPKLADLALFLPMLATAGAGQSLTCYNTLYSAARLPGESDGPREFHIILLDNRRTQLLADAEQRDALHCIRCGACLNVCPIFKNVGGHTYGTVYQGPIGSVITPHLRGLQEWKHLSQASSLCGACTETCPVKINLHHHLLHNRRNAARAQPSFADKILYRGFAFTMTRPAIYQLATGVARLLLPLRQWVNGTVLDPLRPWTKTRAFPSMAPKSFRTLWREGRGEGGHASRSSGHESAPTESKIKNQKSKLAPDSSLAKSPSSPASQAIGGQFSLSQQIPRPRERERVAEGRVRVSGETLNVAERAGVRESLSDQNPVPVHGKEASSSHGHGAGPTTSPSPGGRASSEQRERHSSCCSSLGEGGHASRSSGHESALTQSKIKNQKSKLAPDSSLPKSSSVPLSSRSLIFARIREALKVPAPHPVTNASEDVASYSHSHGAQPTASPSPAGESDLASRSSGHESALTESKIKNQKSKLAPDSSLPKDEAASRSPQQWLPPVGKTVEEQIELFRQNARGLRADFHVCPDLNAAIQIVKTLAANDAWKKIGLHNGELPRAIAGALNLPQVKTDGGYALDDLESCDAGLTECEALVAQTGSVLVSASGSGGRALSVLPPHHIVLARRSQMLPDLTAALQGAREKYGDHFPSLLSFITGPSRTGDIERILVLGAHGPKKLTILLLP